jgi:hypothetical protein
LNDITHDGRPDLVGMNPARAMAALIAMAPRSGAGISFKLPPKVPIAVRTGAIRTTERDDIMDEFSQSSGARQRGPSLPEERI